MLAASSRPPLEHGGPDITRHLDGGPILIKDLPGPQGSISQAVHSVYVKRIAQLSTGATRTVADPWRHGEAKGGTR